MERPDDSTIEEACNELMWAMQKYLDEPSDESFDAMDERLRGVQIIAYSLEPDDNDGE